MLQILKDKLITQDARRAAAPGGRKGKFTHRLGWLPMAAGACLAIMGWQSSGRAQFEGRPMAMGSPPPFTVEQVARGKSVYAASCAMCHGEDLTGGATSKPLKGRIFSGTWATRSTADLFKYLGEKMPPGQTGKIGPDDYAALVALLMNENGLRPGAQPLPAAFAALRGFRMPSRGRDLGMGLAMDIPLPKWPEPANPAARLSPVSDAMLNNPSPADWLLWRRTPDGQGFSPLRQITSRNVKGLRLAWTYALPSGPNGGTPLVHDGVLFVQGSGDGVQAISADTGESLWKYSRVTPAREGPAGLIPSVKRNMALYGDRLFISTGDNKVAALDAKTGELIWETPVPAGMTGGPLVVDGVVVQGLSRPEGLAGGRMRSPPGMCGVGGRIVGMNASDGKLLWTFNVIPQAGDFGTDSWNDLPCDNRSGGAVWTTSYYDPELKLIFVGTANTYDTGPLQKPVVRPGLTHDALFTNTTLALDPKTGKRVWHFQHMAGEQWDLDWVFERVIMPLQLNGKTTKAVVTIGKPGILDALDAATGKYLFSLDPGLQNVVSRIDPVTGEKIYDPAKIPGGTSKFVCPQVGGAKNWTPSSYNPQSGVLYAPLVESCMVMEPVGTGGYGVLTSGVTYRTAPRPDSDGKVGRLQAYDLRNRKLLWSTRQRAPVTSGVLSTAGGVLFAGSLDREFAAFDEKTGKQLWRTRLADVPNGAPISFAVGGKQYVAIVTGFGTMLNSMFPSLVPEIAMPSTPSSAVYVFALD